MTANPLRVVLIALVLLTGCSSSYDRFTNEHDVCIVRDRDYVLGVRIVSSDRPCPTTTERDSQ